MRKQLYLCALFILTGCAQHNAVQYQTALKNIGGSCALQQLEQQAKAGNASAQNGLGLFYRDIRDFKKSIYWLTKSAEQGLTGGQFNLAYCYEQGIGVTKNEKQAQHWYAKAVTQYLSGAQQGNVNYQTAVAFGYYNSLGVSKDLKKAEYWGLKAAKAGDLHAQMGLGIIYMDLENKNSPKAVYWFRKAAEQGLAGAQYNLGLCYEKGYGVIKDAKKASYWYTKAVQQYRKGAEEGNVWQQLNLGHCYLGGRGLPKDQEQGIMWIRKAANQGLGRAGEWLKQHGYQ